MPCRSSVWNSVSRASALLQDLCLGGESGMPGDSCGSELAHEEAGTSGAEAASGIQSSRVSALLQDSCLGGESGMPGDSFGSELAHEEAGTSGAEAASGIQSSRASALLQDSCLGGESGMPGDSCGSELALGRTRTIGCAAVVKPITAVCLIHRIHRTCCRVPACAAGVTCHAQAGRYSLKCPTMPFNSMPREASWMLDAALPCMARAD